MRLSHPEWARSASIYQINQRQFTPEGTFRAAEAHLPRLRDFGVDIVWLMPVNPIGERNRKGDLGSPYAVKDYYAVNPEFGTVDDLRHFVDTAHDLGLHVILDWVANHTAWDNVLVTEHPEWYARDWKGDFRPTPWWDWHDIIDLDYSHEGLREWMTAAMVHWVKEVGVDGYRCDVAGFVPLDFWETVRRELDEVKPVFMLAEWEARDLQVRAFDATYAWSWNETMHRIAHGMAGLDVLTDLLRLERPLLAARRIPDDVRQQPRQERLGGHRVRAVRRRPRCRDRAVGGRRGHPAGLQRPGGRQRQAARVLRQGRDHLAHRPAG